MSCPEIKEEAYNQQDDSMVDLAYQSFDSSDMPHFEKGSLIKLENGDCKKVEELSRDDFEKVTELWHFSWDREKATFNFSVQFLLSR